MVGVLNTSYLVGFHGHDNRKFLILLCCWVLFEPTSIASAAIATMRIHCQGHVAHPYSKWSTQDMYVSAHFMHGSDFHAFSMHVSG